MNTNFFKEMISVIRKEEQRRDSQLTDEDSNFAYDRWLFIDLPFISEFCLMLLVSLRHQVERELDGFAARAADDGKDIAGQKYHDNVEQLRKINQKKKWKEIKNRLKLESVNGNKFIDVLRLLVNSYKHDPSMEPDKELLELLKLETGVNYASLPESNALWEALADFVGLGKNIDYCATTERLVEKVSDFMSEVETRTKLSKVDWGHVSLNPNDCAR